MKSNQNLRSLTNNPLEKYGVYSDSRSYRQTKYLNRVKYPAFKFEGNRIINCNKKALALLGKASLRQVEGKTIAELSPVKQFDGKKSDEKFSYIIDKVRTGGYYGLKWQFVDENNNTVHTKLKINITCNNGSVYSFATAKEIGREMKNEIEIKKVNNDFSSLFLMNISHEVRTPLNAVLGFTQLLEQKELEREKQLEFLSLIKNNGLNLLNLIDNLVLLSELESGKSTFMKVPFSMAELKSKIELLINDLIKQYSKQHLEVLVDFKYHMNTILELDFSAILKLLSELIKNALENTPAGTIYVGCKKVNETKILFYVKDSGVGIELEEQNYIFEKFYKINDNNTNENRGLGIGLPIVKRIVENMGGDLWVSSVPSEGAAFYFTLPIQ